MSELLPIEQRVYGLKDLYDGLARDRAEAHPEAWAAFLFCMKGRLYGPEPFNDAWLWFLQGFLDEAKDGDDG